MMSSWEWGEHLQSIAGEETRFTLFFVHLGLVATQEIQRVERMKRRPVAKDSECKTSHP